MISEKSTSSQDYSPARWLSRARTTWYLVAFLSLVVVIITIPYYIRAVPNGFSAFEFAANPSPVVLAINGLTALISFAAMILCLYLALLLFHRRPDDRMALFLSFYLLVFGFYCGPNNLLISKEPLSLISKVWNSIFTPLIMYPASSFLFLLFPDGRFAPDWSRWLALAALVTAPVGTITYLIWFRSQSDALPIVISSLLSVVVVSGVLYAQFYRYRHIASGQQRQQIKWVVYGLGIMLFLQVATGLPYFWSFTLPASTPYPLWLAITTAIYLLSFAVFPVSLTIAMMRYRLYDIDILINRTLVYGALTVGVVGTYALVVGGVGILFQTQSNLLVALLATGLIAVIFQPLRERLQRAVNRLTYGERDEPFEALSRLGRRLEGTFSPEMVYPTIVETVAEALKLPYAAIAVKRAEQYEIAEAYGNAPQEPVVYPLTHQGEIIGRLLVGRRSPDEDFSPADERLLRNFAREAGTAVHAVRLTADLQHSRQLLVTTREEERLRLRRDLHDGLGPALASVVWQVDSARDLVKTNPAEALQLLESSIEQAQEALADIRRLVYGLRPPALDELGLVGALQQAARQHQQTTVTIKAPETLSSLPAAVEVAAYRIAQEAMKNAEEHGRAERCTVCLALLENNLSLTIGDDGVGLPEDMTPGVGLVSMHERAEELGGVFTIRTQRGSWTKIEVCLPLA